MKKEGEEEEENADDPPFIVAATVGMTSSSSSSTSAGKSSKNNDKNKVELIARQSMPTFVLKMLLCKEAGLKESDYDVRYKGKIIPVLDPNVTLKECGIAKETLSGVSLWENETCRRRKVADELDAYRREKREQFYDEKKKKKNGDDDDGDPRAEARREIERIKARNSYSPESNQPTTAAATTTTTTVERQDTSRYGYGTSSASSQRQPFSSSTANENPAYYYPRTDQYHREQQYHHHQQQQRPRQGESPIVIDDRDDDEDDRRDGIYTNSAERQSHGSDYRQNNYHRQPPPAPPEELDDLAKRRIASDQLQKIIADVDAIKFRVDDILDVHKNDPSLISDALRKTTLKNAREAAHLLEKSLLQADAVESYGFADIRAMRKGLVACAGSWNR